MEFNWQQRHALKLLTKSELVAFKDLKPADVDANLFSYHIKELVRQGLISSNEGIYTLTLEGKHYVGSTTINTGRLTKQPKIVIMLYAERPNGEVLLYHWKRQPYYDKISLPYGKTHFNKTMLENVLHEADMKLGVPITVEAYLGDFYQKITDDDVAVSHMLVHVYKISLGNTPTSKQSGKTFWAKPNSVDRSALIPGFYEILTLIRARQSMVIPEICSIV